MDCLITSTRDLLEGDHSLELSFIELIVAASECSEDETEVGDLIDALLASHRVELRDDAPGSELAVDPPL